MKKIFTLLFATAMLSTTFAQYGQNDQRDRGRDNDVYASNNKPGNDHYGKGYGAYVFTAKERSMEIAQINRAYDYKIQSVKNKPFMAWYQKKRLINSFAAERDAEICQVNDKFNSPKNKFGDYGRNDKKRW